MDWLTKVNIKNKIWEFVYQFCDNIYNSLASLMEETIKLITKFPLITGTPEMLGIWKILVFLCFTCVAAIITYIAGKNLFSSSSNNVIRHTEMKLVMSRLMYMLIFIMLSLPFIDWLIMFNNTLVDVIVSKYNVHHSIDLLMMKQGRPGNDLVGAAIVIYQIYLLIKIMIGYWLRVAEVHLMALVSPIMYTLWINPSWSGYLGSWLSRLTSLIFTQFIQVIVFVLYGQLLYRFIHHGTISSFCLAAASLLLMDNVPTLFNRFIAHDNSFNIMNKTFNGIKALPNKVTSIKNKFFKK